MRGASSHPTDPNGERAISQAAAREPQPPGLRFHPLAALLFFLLASGCAIQRGQVQTFNPRAPAAFVSIDRTNQIDSAWLRPSAEPYRLGPGDQLDIELLGSGELPVSTFVGPDGKVYFHLLPGVQVWDLTLAQTKALLEKELARYIRSPQVAITLRGFHSKRVWIMGRVKAPGIYTLETPMTLLESLAKAGGPLISEISGTTEELANLEYGFVMRRGQTLPLNLSALVLRGDTSQNIYLEPGDFVYLPSSLTSQIYVLGAVSQPKSVRIDDRTTLVSAVAAARGPAAGAWLKHVAIVRGSLSEPSIAVVDYEAIIKGKATDVRLKPRDIVYVPLSPYRKLDTYARMIVTTFVRSVAANEGGQAVETSIGSPGISIPIGQ